MLSSGGGGSATSRWRGWRSSGSSPISSRRSSSLSGRRATARSTGGTSRGNQGAQRPDPLIVHEVQRVQSDCRRRLDVVLSVVDEQRLSGADREAGQAQFVNA